MSGRSRVHVSAAYIYIKWQGVWGVCVCVMYLFRHSIEILGDHGTLLFAGKIQVVDGGALWGLSDRLLPSSVRFTRRSSATVTEGRIEKTVFAMFEGEKVNAKYLSN